MVYLQILHHDISSPNLSAAISSTLSARPSIVVSKSAPVLTPTGLVPAPSPARFENLSQLPNRKYEFFWKDFQLISDSGQMELKFKTTTK